MPKESRTQRTDMNILASGIVDEATQLTNKNPAAVALGRLGGLKGGRARANKLTAEQRGEIAKKAAKTRWAKER